MYLLKNLIRNLENDLSDKGVSESIVLRTSNVPNFDFQINNLVKHPLLVLTLNVHFLTHVFSLRESAVQLTELLRS